MIETKLSNLTLLQIMGGVDPFADNFSDYSQNDLDRIVDFKMNETTTPHLYESILEKSISAQLGNGDGYLREITQNGIDSYNPYSHKKIEFTTEEDEHGGLLLTVKDYGCGMSTRDVIKNLLIPYN